VPFPEDLSDILPLFPGETVVRRVNLSGTVILVEIKGFAEGKYDLHVDIYYEGEMIRIFGVENIESEETVELIWRQFLSEKRTILAGHQPK
jgi:hypothetical protein